MTLTEEEKFFMIENMAKYGGSFVKALAECFRKADMANFNRLVEAFPEYVAHYKVEKLYAKEN